MFNTFENLVIWFCKRQSCFSKTTNDTKLAFPSPIALLKLFCFVFKFLVDTCPFMCFGFLVMSPLGFKARVGNLICTFWQRYTWYTFPNIHLWCDTFPSVYDQHSSQSLSPHACLGCGTQLGDHMLSSQMC